ncbi:MAG: RHS repeat-associated core domain-containing protein [Anaerolineae bacterium]|nr:RHS repeat-associated core domain-containing protein [Anaerolineae bacterium]
MYTGQRYDAETGLYILRTRYYGPSDGRFLSRDSYAYNYQNPFELNRYIYAANNPITNYDPSGQFVLVGYASGHDPSLKARAMVGGFGGALFGSLSFASFYILAITNTCGSALNE